MRKAMRSWLARQTFTAPRATDDALDVLWSKGIARFCDYHGDDAYWCAATEQIQPAAFFERFYADARELVWIRLGTGARDGKTIDLDQFVAAALPSIKAPFALVTTDGDLTVPADLRPETVSKLLSSPYLVAWATQNWDGTHPDRIRPIPIGLDLHTPRAFSSPSKLLKDLRSVASRRRPVGMQPLCIFSDLAVSKSSDERRTAIRMLAACSHVTSIRKRIPQGAIWRHYAGSPFVLSTAGNGLDCHRTWEALMLGSIVITRTSTLDPLFEGLPVVIVREWEEARDTAKLSEWLRHYAPLTDQAYLRSRLKPEFYLTGLRSALGGAAR